MANHISMHAIVHIEASAPDTIGAPVSMTLTDHNLHMDELTIYVGDQARAEALVVAITQIYKDVKPPSEEDAPGEVPS